MLITPSQASLSRYAEFLTKLSNYLLGIALLCYLTGFAITNMYLGSLGIVNLDILRARYILTGFLFLLFLGAIAYLVYGLIQTLRTNRHMSVSDLVRKVIGYSFQKIAMLYWVIPAIAIFAGVKNLPLETFQPSSPLSWSVWFATEPFLAFQRAAWLIGLVFITVILVVGIVIVVVNPKNKHGIRRPRKQILTETLDAIRKEGIKSLGIFLGMFVLTFIFFLIYSLLTFIISSKVNTPTSTTTWLPEGWSQYFVAVVVVYSLIAAYLTFIFILPSSKDEEQSQDPLARTSAWIYLITIGILIILPVYAFGIYPRIPQQVGGGQLLRVEVVVSSNDLKSYFTDTDINAYLIDRTSNSSLFLLVGKNKQTPKIIEVSGNIIQSLTYTLPP